MRRPTRRAHAGCSIIRARSAAEESPMLSRFTPIGLIVAVFSFLLFATGARADDAFYAVPLHKLTFTQGTLPTNAPGAFQYGRYERMVLPSATIDGQGEAYIRGAEEDVGSGWSMFSWSPETAVIGIRAPKGVTVAGMLSIPDSDGTKAI